jgi:uncharacterized protein
VNAQAMTERLEMRLGQSVLEELDLWRAKQVDLPSRSEAVRRLVETGLHETPSRISFSNSEKLIVLMLCQLLKGLKVEGEIDPSFVEQVIFGGHYWALGWEYSGVFHNYEDADAVVSEVVNILDMWSFLERGFKALSKSDKAKVGNAVEIFGDRVAFHGFDGNGESEYIGVARFLIDKLLRFTEFKGRELNAHMPTLSVHRHMLAAFEPIRRNLMGRGLNASEIIQVMGADPFHRKRKDEKKGMRKF